MKIAYPKLSFTTKLTSFLLVISVFPLLLFQFASYETTRSSVIDEAIKHNMQLLSYQRDYLNLQMEQINGLATNLSSIDEIRDALESSERIGDSPTNYDLLSAKAQIGYVLSGYSNLQGLVSIDLFSLNGSQYHVGDTLNVSNVRIDLRDRLLQSTMNEPDRLIWHGVENNVNTTSSNRKVIVATKSINRWKHAKVEPAGMLLINFSTDYLHAYFSKLELGENAYLMVIDAQQRLLFHPDVRLIGQTVETGLGQLMKGESGSQSLKLDGKNVLLSYLQIPDKQWYIISVVPDSNLSKTLLDVERMGIALLILNLLLILVFIRAYLKQVVSPVRAIAEGFEKFQSTGVVPEQRLTSPKTTLEEIHELVAWFNKFLDTLEANKQAQTSLRIAATAFESQEGMVVTDADTVILNVNHAFAEITGYSTEEAVGQKMNILKSGRHDRSFYAALWESVHTRGMWQGEIWNKRKDESIYPEWLTISSVKNEAGQVTHYVGTITDISSRKAAENEIKHLAFYDALTELPNRRLLHERLDRAIAASRRSGRLIALMFLDLDNFKPLNDLYGHKAGDQLLVEAAQRINACVRETDTVSRFGGDEFVVLLNELDIDKESSETRAAIVADKIRNTLMEPYRLDINVEDSSGSDIEHRCTSSIGVIVFGGQEFSGEEAMKLADIAMYRAKEDGRNCVRFHEGEQYISSKGGKK
ncbi:MAG: diguanylate cyclase [Sideroxydans sp.]